MSFHDGFGGGEIGGIVRAEAQIGSGFCAFGECLEKAGLHDPIFVMTALRPWIRKKDKDTLENNLRWKCGDAFCGFGFEENEIGQLGAVAFAHSAFHSITNEIDANAKLCRMRCGVICKEMSVTGAYLERDAWVRSEQIGQLMLESFTTGSAAGDELGGSGGMVHAYELADKRVGEKARNGPTAKTCGKFDEWLCFDRGRWCAAASIEKMFTPEICSAAFGQSRRFLPALISY